jgi:hypothetical protein
VLTASGRLTSEAACGIFTYGAERVPSLQEEVRYEASRTVWSMAS